MTVALLTFGTALIGLALYLFKEFFSTKARDRKAKEKYNKEVQDAETQDDIESIINRRR